MTKICKQCGKELSIEMFEPGRRVCKQCRKQYRKQRRDKHPEIHNEQSKRAQQKKTEWLYKLKTQCIICGEPEPCCLDFHHIDPNEKDFTIGKHRNRGKDWLLNEIKKCVCVCSNCHRKIHAGKLSLNEYLPNQITSINQ